MKNHQSILDMLTLQFAVVWIGTIGVIFRDTDFSETQTNIVLGMLLSLQAVAFLGRVLLDLRWRE